jgi:hypothetical protein
MTAQRCEIEFRERNGDKWEIIGSSEFTAQDARAAGTKNMDKYARNMLFARAMSNGARWYCPDIFGGPVYTPEEMGATVDRLVWQGLHHVHGVRVVDRVAVGDDLSFHAVSHEGTSIGLS